MTKPLALLIADDLEQFHPHEAAAELRRQHKLFGELVAALEAAAFVMRAELADPEDSGAYQAVCAVLLKAKQEQS